MSATAFTFYRGTAAIMASDLSKRPTTDLRTQLCGDARLSNFPSEIWQYGAGVVREKCLIDDGCALRRVS
jgi:uncharacterized protein (DUF2252 family)